MSDGDPSVTERLAGIRSLVESSRAISVLAGAGISAVPSPSSHCPVGMDRAAGRHSAAGAGIPSDSSQAIEWSGRAADELLTGPGAVDLDAYRQDPTLRVRIWRAYLRDPAWRASPAPAHHAVAALDRSGRLVAVLAQGTDGLFGRAGVDASRLLELHGTIHVVECLSCGERVPAGRILRLLDAGEPDPRCGACGGLLKPATVAAGQALDPDVLYGAVLAVQRSELLVVAGAELDVQPARSLVEIAAGGGIPVVMLTAGPTVHDRLARAGLHGDVAWALTGALRGVGPPASS